MNTVYKKLLMCVESIQKKIDFQPEVALILDPVLEIMQMRFR